MYKHIVNMLFFTMKYKGLQIMNILSWFFKISVWIQVFFAYDWECYSKFISQLILSRAREPPPSFVLL